MDSRAFSATVFPVTVEQAYLAFATVLADNLAYTGQGITPPVMVISDNGLILTEGVHYRLAYDDNIRCGIGRVEITGIGACENPDAPGPIVDYFAIVPASPEIASLSAQNGEFRLSVADLSETGADGYEARYRMKGSTEWISASFEPGQTDLAVSGLAAGEYEVQVCAFVDNSSASVPEGLKTVTRGSYGNICSVVVP